MGAVYEFGSSAKVTFTFTDAAGNPKDPTAVTYRLRRPDDMVAVYVSGVAPEVSHPSVGRYDLALAAAALPLAGLYHWRAEGTGAVEEAGEDTLEVLASAVLAPVITTEPTLGPCESWIDGASVAACCPAGVGSDPGILDVVAAEASMALYEISGRQFPGRCERKVRPCRQECACFGGSVSAGPWYWTSGWAGGWTWRNECGDRCGCAPLSVVRLAGYPVRDIVEVKIDGAVLPALDGGGHPNYRLDGYRRLVRMSDPGPPVQQRDWPACQDLSLDDGQPGTFSVTYRWGVDPPELGRRAAAQLACQLYLSCAGQECVLPQGTTKVVRQGVTVERGLLANWFDPTKPTGLVALDTFLKAYWPSRGRRRPAVWSPDIGAFARREGT